VSEPAISSFFMKPSLGLFDLANSGGAPARLR
jgi:hypothetical protein